MLIRWEGEKIKRIMSDPAHPVSRGWSCARGRAATAKYHRNRRGREGVSDSLE
ncbi:MAG: hypothetical protein HOC20_13365 [Chloroflexi bacterium]|nr:hypothetical protein [Chloroflexota bacterium]